MKVPVRLKLLRWAKAVTLRTFVLMLLAVVASGGFLVIASLLERPAFDKIDATIELFIHHHLDSPIGDVWAMTASLIGSNAFLIPTIVLVTVLAAARRHRVAAVVLICDAVFVMGADQCLKLMFQRARPQLFDKIALPHDYSFPSGHSMSAMGVWGVIAAVLVALYPQLKREIVALAVLLIASIGLSRIYLGVHWPFDVAGGFLAGIPPLIASIHLIHRRTQRDANVASLVEAVEAR
ncbi:MAG: phosphatase PAP2 family protein [Kofleriaceae bacterium]